jgi:hypothetical protein
MADLDSNFIAALGHMGNGFEFITSLLDWKSCVEQGLLR